LADGVNAPESDWHVREAGTTRLQLAVLEKLRRQGVGLAMYDSGTGYMSLA
jgi:plasmid stability protein